MCGAVEGWCMGGQSGDTRYWSLGYRPSPPPHIRHGTDTSTAVPESVEAGYWPERASGPMLPPVPTNIRLHFPPDFGCFLFPENHFAKPIIAQPFFVYYLCRPRNISPYCLHWELGDAYLSLNCDQTDFSLQGNLSCTLQCNAMHWKLLTKLYWQNHKSDTIWKEFLSG